MRASLIGTLVASCAFVVSVAAVAQEKPAPSGQKEHTMTGCLQKGSDAKTFIVNSTVEKGPKTIGIVASTPDLAPHVGHKIDITGTAVPNAEAESMKPAPPKADHYMRLTAIKMVSATCP
jgi:hypothetical protein